MKSIEQEVLFLLTVDTEEEWEWDGPLPRAPFSTRNISRLPRFQEFCRGLGVKPTYFVDYAVADDANCVRILQKYFERSECDIGAHLHPWCTPPITEKLSPENSHMVNLHEGLVRQKLQNLTKILTERFGTHPFSFRAGRWGMSGQLLRILADLGYSVDSSVRPFYRDDCFTYEGAPDVPYWPDFNDINKAGNQRKILEIPVSDGFNIPNFRMCQQAQSVLSKKPFTYLHSIGILWRLGLMRKISASPEGQSASDINTCIDAHVTRGNRIINLFLHSSDLEPGCTPFVRNEAEGKKFSETITRVVEYVAAKYTMRSVTVREAYGEIVEEISS